MVEQGKKKAVASAFEWPGWDRGGKSEDDALAVLATYRPRYARVAELAGLQDKFRATGEMEVVERVEGTGMTDFYGLSARSAGPEQEPVSEAECERKIAWSGLLGLLRRRRLAGLGRTAKGAAWRRARPGQDRPSYEWRRD